MTVRRLAKLLLGAALLQGGGATADDSKSTSSISRFVTYEGRPFALDLSSLGDTPLATYQVCQREYTPDEVLQNGTRIKVLGIAVTYFAPGYRTSPLGHLSLRTIYCYNSFTVDQLVEWTKYSDAESENFTFEYPDLQPEDFREALGKRLFLKRIVDPATFLGSNSLGYGRNQYLANRNIFETWLRLEPAHRLAILKTITAERDKQEQALRTGAPLERYDKFKNSCVSKIRRLLQVALSDRERKAMGAPVLPRTFFRKIHALRGEFGVYYPAQRSLRMLWRRDAKTEINKSDLPAPTQLETPIDRSPLIVYPYGVTAEPDFPQNFLAATVNLPINLAATAISTGKALFTADWRAVKVAGSKVVVSFLQLLGWTFIHPAPTSWTPAELEAITLATRAKPRVLSYLDSYFDGSIREALSAPLVAPESVQTLPEW